MILHAHWKTTKSAGFFTFGTGIVVGLGAAFAMRATMPRATEMVGLILQKMGFELGDMLLALWDPEATYQQTAALPGSGIRPPVGKKKRLTKPRAAVMAESGAQWRRAHSQIPEDPPINIAHQRQVPQAFLPPGAGIKTRATRRPQLIDRRRERENLRDSH